MKNAKTTIWITFIGGLIVLLIGIFMQITNQSSEGFVYSIRNYGDSTAYSQVINGFVVIYLGVFLLLLSLFHLYFYRKDKKKWDNWKD